MKSEKELLVEQYLSTMEYLEKKWDFLLEGIKDEYRRGVTAILLENAYKLLNGELITEGMDTGDVIGINRILLPIIRRVYPNLMAHNFVTVQPMLTPTAQIFYLRYKYGATLDTISQYNARAKYKGMTKAGHEFLRVPPYGDFGLNPYYTSEKIWNEPLYNEGDQYNYEVNGDELKIYLLWTPIKNEDIVLTIAGKDDSDHDVSAEITISNPLSGSPVINNTNTDFITNISFDPRDNSPSNPPVVTITKDSNYSYEVGNSVINSYSYDLENNDQIPETRITIETDFIHAKERKTKFTLTPEALYDLKALHNIDAEAELVNYISSELVAEIDREILRDLLYGAGITLEHNYMGSGSVNYINYLDRNQALASKIIEASSLIHKFGKLGSGNWCITSPEIAAKLESVRGFESANKGEFEEFDMGIVFSGYLPGRSIKVFKDPYFPPGKILVGYKGNQFLATSYVFAPYQPLYTTPLIWSPTTGVPVRFFLTRYGKRLVVGGEYLLAVINVHNLESDINYTVKPWTKPSSWREE